MTKAGALLAGLNERTGKDGWILDATIGAKSREKLSGAVDSMSKRVASQSVGRMIGLDTAIAKVAGRIDTLGKAVDTAINKVTGIALPTLKNIQRETSSKDTISLIDKAKTTMGGIGTDVGKGVDGVKGSLTSVGPAITAAGFGAAGLFLALILKTLHIIHD